MLAAAIDSLQRYIHIKTPALWFWNVCKAQTFWKVSFDTNKSVYWKHCSMWTKVFSCCLRNKLAFRVQVCIHQILETEGRVQRISLWDTVFIPLLINTHLHLSVQSQVWRCGFRHSSCRETPCIRCSLSMGSTSPSRCATTWHSGWKLSRGECLCYAKNQLSIVARHEMDWRLFVLCAGMPSTWRTSRMSLKQNVCWTVWSRSCRGGQSIRWVKMVSC